jgi:hypothetical protein
MMVLLAEATRQDSTQVVLWDAIIAVPLVPSSQVPSVAHGLPGNRNGAP